MSEHRPSFVVELLRMSVKLIVGTFVFVFAALLGIVTLGASSDFEADTVNMADELQFSYIYGEESSFNKLLQLNISGPILGTAPEVEDNPFGLISATGASFGYAIKTTLEKAAKEEDVKGIFLHISTPGGTIFGSMAIFDGIKAYQTVTGNPVFAYIEGISASGGVMSMVAADKIYADAGSLIGSIGVIGEQIFYYDSPKAISNGLLGGGVTTDGGIEQTIIYAGRSKDLGNPFRRLTETERTNLQDSVDRVYEQFVEHVADARQISTTTIRDEMGAQVFDNNQAQGYGLIDGTLSWDGTIDALATEAGLGKDFQLVRLDNNRNVSFLSYLMHSFPDIGRKTQKSQDEFITSAIRKTFCSPSASRILVYFGSIKGVCHTSY